MECMGGEARDGGVVTLYGAYHFARRVLPLVYVSVCVVRRGWGVWVIGDVLTVLD